MSTDSERSSLKEYKNNNIICAIFSTVGTSMLFYWICCVCSWCVLGVGLPKWINTITSSKWLWHLVPLPVIILMFYRLLLSREPNLHAMLLIPLTNIHIILHHTPSPFPHSAIRKPTIHFFMALWNDYATSWLDTLFIRSHWKDDQACWEGGSKVDVIKALRVYNSICLLSIIYVIDAPFIYCEWFCP